jgi:hypothetical protein
MMTLSNHPPSTLIKILNEFSSAESSSSLMKAFFINIFTHSIKTQNTKNKREKFFWLSYEGKAIQFRFGFLPNR